MVKLVEVKKKSFAVRLNEVKVAMTYSVPANELDQMEDERGGRKIFSASLVCSRGLARMRVQENIGACEIGAD